MPDYMQQLSEKVAEKSRKAEDDALLAFALRHGFAFDYVRRFQGPSSAELDEEAGLLHWTSGVSIIYYAPGKAHAVIYNDSGHSDGKLLALLVSAGTLPAIL